MNLKACKIGVFCFLLSACSSDNSTVQSVSYTSTEGEVTKEEIYSWAKNEEILKVKTKTTFENKYTDEILATTRLKFSRGHQFVLRGWIKNNDEMESIQVYTISTFHGRSENDWPNLTSALQDEIPLDITVIPGEVLCHNPSTCTFYEHVAVNFEDFAFLKEQAVKGDFEFTLIGDKDKVQYTIPGNYLKGFVLAIQEYIDERSQYQDTDYREIKLKNRLIN